MNDQPLGQHYLDDARQTFRDYKKLAERAFAHTATLKGTRDAFLDFFADDAIALTPLPASAKERLRGRSSQPFSDTKGVMELVYVF